MRIYERPLVYQIPEMEPVRILQDITYKPEKDLKMDIYLPLEPGNYIPGVIFVHGGPIPPEASPKNWGIFTGYGRLAAALGVVGVTFNHRFYSWPDVEQAADDIVTALEYIRDNADLFHLDRDRLCFWAFSGGGAFLSLVFCKKFDFIRCIVAYYTVMDLHHYGDKISEEVIHKFSAVSYVGTGLYTGPPMFIARAGQDNYWLNQEIDIFLTKALASNADIELMNHPDGRHGFDILDDNPRSREIIVKSMDFVKSKLAE